MTIYAVLFYIIAALIIVSTGMAVTRENMVHAVLYLVVSFLGSALLFFLLGAPLPGILQVIIYAGAIMVLFLFIVMMIRIEPPGKRSSPIRHYVAVGVICGIYFGAVVLLMRVSEPAAREPMAAAIASPAVFGHYLFEKHWLAIEMVSLLLLVALIGALHLGLSRIRRKTGKGEVP